MIRATLALVLLLVAATAVVADTQEELKELKLSFKKRYPTLAKMRKAGRIGETFDGYVEAVKADTLKEKVDPKAESSPTVAEFLKTENEDRGRLYVILAKRSETTPEKVAARNAARNFDRAGAEEFLKTKDGKWVKKKDLKPRQE